MRDLGHDTAGVAAGGGAATALRPEDVKAWTKQLIQAHEGLADHDRIEMIRALEELKCASEATQAVVTVDFDKSQRQRAAQAGVPRERQGRGIAGQVALARRESPWWGERHLQLAKVLATELPYTLAAFRAGKISERRARIVAQETACLSLEHRMRIDEELAGDPARIEAMGDRQLRGEIGRRAYALDPRAVAERRKHAESERRVTTRPTPDVMGIVTALLPIKDAVAVHAALHREYQRLNLAGDPRTKGQIMADTLVQRVVNPGQADTDQGKGTGLMVNVVVPDTVLFGDGDQDGDGHAEGFGTVPGDLIREWVAENLEDGIPTFLRRLYETPATGDLVGMDSKATRFAGKLAEFLRIRDQHCRTA